MPVEVILPKLSTTMDEGTIVAWLKQEGDAVLAGQPLYDLETDKVTMTVEAPASGTLSRVLSPAGTTAPVGQIVALISGAEPAAPTLAAPPAMTAATPEPRRVKASPLARRLAEELGVDLLMVGGTGPDGRIIEADIRAAAERRAAAAPLPASGHELPTVTPERLAEHARRMAPISQVRRVTSERLALSARTVARVTLTAGADATRLVDWRSRLKAQPRGALVPTYADLVIFLVARLLPEYPYLNARFEGNAICLHDEVNIGLAVDTERGLLVPVLRQAHRKDLPALVCESAALVERARVGRATLEDLSGGTFTVTNLGMYAIEAFTPIINLPECAVLGLGQIAPKPAVYQNELAIRQMVSLSLAFDHRLVDGAPAARFLHALKELIEEPLLLFSGGGGDQP